MVNVDEMLIDEILSVAGVSTLKEAVKVLRGMLLREMKKKKTCRKVIGKVIRMDVSPWVAHSEICTKCDKEIHCPFAAMYYADEFYTPDTRIDSLYIKYHNAVVLSEKYE